MVDDNSPDGTSHRVQEYMKQNPNVFLITRKKREGLGKAYIAGFKFAINNSYDFVFEMDADFSHSPDMIPKFLYAARSADLIIGSRYLGKVANVINWPIHRLLLSKSASLYTRAITRMPVQDPTSGFKCFRIESLKALDLDKIRSTGYSFQIEIDFKLWKKGFRICEIPIIFSDRISGSSKMNKGIILEAFFAVWILKAKSLFKKK